MKVLITGSNGRLGRALMAAIPGAIGSTRDDWNLDDGPAEAIDVLRRNHMPDVVIHTAAMTDTEACAREPEVALRRNAVATASLATACHWTTAQMIYISTNEVFDGKLVGRGYFPNDTPRPINPYGESKYRGELMANQIHGPWLAIVRTAWMFGGGNDFPAKIIRLARQSPPKMPLAVTSLETGSPTYAADAARVIAGIARDFKPGIYHVVNRGEATRLQFAKAILHQAGIDHEVAAVASWPRLSTPPANAVLSPTVPLRSWRFALAAYAKDGGLLQAA